MTTQDCETKAEALREENERLKTDIDELRKVVISFMESIRVNRSLGWIVGGILADSCHLMQRAAKIVDKTKEAEDDEQ